MIKKLLFIFLFLFFSHFLQAQQTYTNTDNNEYFRTGLELLDKEHFAAARLAFENYLRLYPNDLKSIEAEYYIAYTALQLY
ncbi:MAG: hypothetical protein M3512_07695, partial [Bacteroidota bacterium]|nr:hypothetical protein [Bacteroidota bacterium]